MAFATVVEAFDAGSDDVVAETAAPEATRQPARVKTSNARNVGSLFTSSPQQITRPGVLTMGNRVDSASSFFGRRLSFNTARQALESFVFLARHDSIHISGLRDSESSRIGVESG
ncbi:MAG: hypothetical protein WBA53_01490 [Burkholderiaceae bacterium]